jgi:Zn-dependent protease
VASGPSFRVLGVPVRIDPTFFVIAAVLGIGGGSLGFVATWVVVVTVSVLIHELGHAVAFRMFGKRPQILLQGMGGVTSASGELRPVPDILVSLAGPLTGLVLIGLPALVLERSAVGASPWWHTTLRILVFVNVAWSVVNLLPVLPLDGGRVTASVLGMVSGDRGLRAAHMVSIAIAAVGGMFAFTRNYPGGALFAIFFVGWNVSALRQEKAQTVEADLSHGYRSLIGGDTHGALVAADELLAEHQDPASAAAAAELRAWAQLRADGPVAAGAALRTRPGGRPGSINGFLLGSLALESGDTDTALDAYAAAFAKRQLGPWNVLVADALARRGLAETMADRLMATDGAGTDALVALQWTLHDAGRWREAVAVGTRAFDAGTDVQATVAYNVACSAARAGQVDDALSWVERAVDAGFTDGELLDTDADLAPVRNTARFGDVRQRVGGS